MGSGMNPTIASAKTEAHRAEQVFLASQKAISLHEGGGKHPAQPPNPARSVSSNAIRSVTLAGPAGQLEALLNQGAPDARFAALLCHPHPLGGGNLHNKVVYHAMKVLNESAGGLSFPVLRFNFRGAGLSEGAHDGVAETGDVLA